MSSKDENNSEVFVPTGILVTGGCGFIGTNFIYHVFQSTGFTGVLVNLDKLTYAGDARNLDGLLAWLGDAGRQRYVFVEGDVCDEALVLRLLTEHRCINAVVHFAAESHVDRSILAPGGFVHTNVVGTAVLLQAALTVWGPDRRDVRFHHVSTDEVYGSLPPGAPPFTESAAYCPSSPYSASKAASDHLVRAWHRTYGLPVTLSNCSNNYGPYQFPEKLVPLVIANLLDAKPLPVYGDGSNVRDWLHVDDHVAAVWAILTRGRVGHTYNVGAACELSNIELVRHLCRRVAAITATPVEDHLARITFVPDRKGHDFRYAIDASKLRTELAWRPLRSFNEAIDQTIHWYLQRRQQIQ